jgi:predicted 3-demethylubiquinone-9 3-methyltransferase (glyoxalase superfamily)
MRTTDQRISPMLWFDNQAEEAAKFYTLTFPNSSIGRVARYGKEGFEIHGQKEGTVMTMDFTLDGQKFSALNGGPLFKINPSISFFATYEQEGQVDEIWKKLSEGGSVLMPLDKYPWSQKYGWVQDRFGVSWQIAVGNRKDVGGQSIITSLMFVREYYGEAEKAMKLYTSVFMNSEIKGILRYGEEDKGEKAGTVKHAQFTLGNQTFMAMDSGMEHQFSFNEAVSLVIPCETQEEVDYYWEKLAEGGDPKAQVCGWLKDRYGVSWQVVPNILVDMLHDQDKAKVEHVTRAYLGMKKFDIAELKRAFNSAEVASV